MTDLVENHRSSPAPNALALLLAGETEAGLAAYETCFSGRHPHNLPIGLHLSFLERAGRSEVAAALRDLALRRGSDIAVKAVALGAPPAESAREYEALFASGIVNAWMVFEYLVALSRIGETDKVAGILDLDRLLRIVRLDLPGPTGGELAPAVAALLLREEAGAVDQAGIQPFTRMARLQQLERLDDPVAQALVAALRQQADLYLRDWADSRHPLAHLVPRQFDFKAWGLIARDEGYSSHHVHPVGWATGVYYPLAIPGPGGELEIGPPESLEVAAPEWPRRTIRPEAGLLVLLPSYCMHWTVPLAGAGVRLSVGCDVIGRTLPQTVD